MGSDVLAPTFRQGLRSLPTPTCDRDSMTHADGGFPMRETVKDRLMFSPEDAVAKGRRQTASVWQCRQQQVSTVRQWMRREIDQHRTTRLREVAPLDRKPERRQEPANQRPHGSWIPMDASRRDIDSTYRRVPGLLRDDEPSQLRSSSNHWRCRCGISPRTSERSHALFSYL